MGCVERAWEVQVGTKYWCVRAGVIEPHLGDKSVHTFERSTGMFYLALSFATPGNVWHKTVLRIEPIATVWPVMINRVKIKENVKRNIFTTEAWKWDLQKCRRCSRQWWRCSRLPHKQLYRAFHNQGLAIWVLSSQTPCLGQVFQIDQWRAPCRTWGGRRGWAWRGRGSERHLRHSCSTCKGTSTHFQCQLHRPYRRERTQPKIWKLLKTSNRLPTTWLLHIPLSTSCGPMLPVTCSCSISSYTRYKE